MLGFLNRFFGVRTVSTEEKKILQAIHDLEVRSDLLLLCELYRVNQDQATGEEIKEILINEGLNPYTINGMTFEINPDNTLIFKDFHRDLINCKNN